MARICEDCEKDSRWPLARGRCRTCYPKHVQALKEAGIFENHWRRSPERRILAQTTPGWGGCVIWTGSTSSGYGQIRIAGVHRGAHRVLYEILVGPVPAHLELDHTCHTESPTCPGGECIHRRCVNPNHLEPVTPTENKLRGRSPSAENALKTHCLNGHEYSQDNTYWTPSNERSCRACRRKRNREAYVKRPRVRKERTHCRNGHLRTEDNLFTDSKGGRTCRECQREAARRHKARKKQQRTTPPSS